MPVIRTVALFEKLNVGSDRSTRLDIKQNDECAVCEDCKEME